MRTNEKRPVSVLEDGHGLFLFVLIHLLSRDGKFLKVEVQRLNNDTGNGGISRLSVALKLREKDRGDTH